MTGLIRILQASYPELWGYTGFLFIFGVLAALAGGTVPPLHTLAYLVWFFVGANLFGMLFNDYYDRALDAHNPRKQKPCLTEREFALGIGIGLGSYALLAYTFPSPIAATWVFLAVMANVLYSMPPFRLKEFPPFDVLGGPASFLTAVFAGYAVAGGGWPNTEAALAGLLFFSGIDLAFKTLDIEADARGGIRTSATLLGRTGALLLSGFLLATAGASIAALEPLFALGILPYLGILFLIARGTDESARAKLDRRLPAYYFLSGFAVTAAFVANFLLPLP